MTTKHEFAGIVEPEMERDHLIARHKLDVSHAAPEALATIHRHEHGVKLPGEVPMPQWEYFLLFQPSHPVPWRAERCTGRGPHYNEWKVLSAQDTLVMIVRYKDLADRIIEAVNDYESRLTL